MAEPRAYAEEVVDAIPRWMARRPFIVPCRHRTAGLLIFFLPLCHWLAASGRAQDNQPESLTEAQAAVAPRSDRITLHRPPPAQDMWSGPQHEIVNGRILQFDQEWLVYIGADGQQHSVASDLVEQVDVQWANDAARQAKQLVDRREYRAAIRALESAVKSGIPRWQQRLLIADLVRCVEAIGQPRVAGVLFLNLARSAPPLLVYADMPLTWSAQEPDASMAEQLDAWFTSSDPHARLLAASWLLSGNRRQEAESVLTELQASSIRGIALLATLQAWRATPPTETEGRVAEWMAVRDSLLRPLQLGPTLWLAERLEATGHRELALGQWMRIVTQHGDRYHRWQVAAGRAAGLIQAVGSEDEAQRLNAWIVELSEPVESP
ncbi:MAG: hypothetical protein KatS3mg111_1403 [Pirellulaceae bacterium]|nr:MAG: hypothetical protein KatS3mg111_1403 [Pirellulaceae bacterium]